MEGKYCPRLCSLKTSPNSGNLRKIPASSLLFDADTLICTREINRLYRTLRKFPTKYSLPHGKEIKLDTLFTSINFTQCTPRIDLSNKRRVPNNG